MAKATGLCCSDSRRRKLDVAACAKSLSARVGEASHPGPRGQPRQARPANLLLDVQVVEAGTRKIQGRVWDSFVEWLQHNFSEDAKEEMFKSPSLAAAVLHHYMESGFLLMEEDFTSSDAWW